jgi:hypothetical protein
MAEYNLDTDVSSYIMKRSHDTVLRHVEVLEFPDEAALHYPQVRAGLKRAAGGSVRTIFSLRRTFAGERRQIFAQSLARVEHTSLDGADR